MSEPPLDLATLPLDYEGFRKLALDARLTQNEKIGFPPAYRDGFETAIFADILAKLPALAAGEGLRVVDIGPGCGGLPKRLIELCRQRRHRLVLVDSPEMLAQLPDVDGQVKCAGPFPQTASDVARALGGAADAVLCYSVLQYVFVDANPFAFVDALAASLAPGGRALVGDIPNHSKRRRFFATERGQAFHRAFTGSSQFYEIAYDTPAPGKIDDAALIGLMMRAQAAGCDAYLLPQGAGLPMANRRDDLLLTRP
jgi:2-polyprenyl-3-methyl-5-hydroxy-6-metoxy-1,4-benzoquinol methylase